MYEHMKRDLTKRFVAAAAVELCSICGFRFRFDPVLPGERNEDGSGARHGTPMTTTAAVTTGKFESCKHRLPSDLRSD